MKILGIDYGTKRIGLAISDENQMFARELDIFSPKQFWQEIENVLDEQGVETIVIGLPLNMSGQSSQKTEEVKIFKTQLEAKTGLPIEFMDERLSSVMAENLPGGRRDIDSLAAQIILQNHLDKKINMKIKVKSKNKDKPVKIKVKIKKN